MGFLNKLRVFGQGRPDGPSSVVAPFATNCANVFNKDGRQRMQPTQAIKPQTGMYRDPEKCWKRKRLVTLVWLHRSATPKQVCGADLSHFLGSMKESRTCDLHWLLSRKYVLAVVGESACTTNLHVPRLLLPIFCRPCLPVDVSGTTVTKTVLKTNSPEY